MASNLRRVLILREISAWKSLRWKAAGIQWDSWQMLAKVYSEMPENCEPEK